MRRFDKTDDFHREFTRQEAWTLRVDGHLGLRSWRREQINGFIVEVVELCRGVYQPIVNRDFLPRFDDFGEKKCDGVEDAIEYAWERVQNLLKMPRE